MYHLFRTFLLIFILQFSLNVWAQPLSKKKSDAIKIELKTKLNDTIRVLKLQTLSLYYVTKVGEEKADMDSSYVFAREAELLTNKINFNRGKWMSYILYSQIYREGGHTDKGKKQLAKAFKIARENKNFWLEAEAYRELSNYYEFDNSGINTRIKIVAKALDAAEKGGSKRQIADILVYYGGHYNMMGNFKESLEKFNEAKALYKAIGYTDLQNLYSQLFSTYLRLGLYPEGIEYGLISIKYGEKIKDYFFLTEDYTNLGYAYYNMANYELALKYHLKAYEYSSKIYSEFYPFYNANFIIKDLLKLGRKKEAISFLDTAVKNEKIKDFRDEMWFNICHITLYDELGWLTLADKYCKSLIEIQKSKRNFFPEFSNLEINNTIINHLCKIKNYPLASKYLAENRKLGTVMKDVNMLINVHLMEFKIDSATGNYLNAIKHLKNYQKTKDRLFNEVKSYQISNLQIKYETDKKDKDIKLLTQESDLQRTKIEKDKTEKIIAGVILILVLIITGLIFRGYQNKKESNKNLQISQDRIQKKNKLLQNVIQEKEWLLKEIHHRVKNNLQVVMSLLNTQSNYLKDESAVNAIKDSQNRINSMSMIHQRLYQSEGLSCIKMQEYVKELISYLKDSYKTNFNFVVDVENIEMHVSQAVPIGLILNEAITNAIKYAFTDGKKGTISIALKHFRDDYFMLEIADNGIGIEGEIEVEKYDSLGMQLMEGLSKDLNGKFSVINSNGLKVSVIFIYNYTFNAK
ncbi:hypothetical protein IRZ71_04210 [Flavobacterium sp. ANB]|uniref:tetratricopeptide repeat-containing sensor histidine kinase n=1 Tax=unclassified Flavobacterium TaxID=196869 RepID=UPI0012B75BA4|nr:MULTISPECIES: histidine kinase dimerization/phosphoacceptor domain -containing protein [unclassified Flavobacterium]MBF4515529.1 hypothetical protein [Flavobacterium sp. ANB]MTD68532.1 hypothetical protein [Flavobacterium sp. LC2016-13]